MKGKNDALIAVLTAAALGTSGVLPAAARGPGPRYAGGAAITRYAGMGNGYGGGMGRGYAGGNGVGHAYAYGHYQSPGRSMGGGYAAGAPVAIKMRRYQMPAPHVFQNPNHIVTEQRHIQWPRYDGHGAPIRQSPAVRPPAQHATIVRNNALVNDIQFRQRVEVTPNHYYWHNEHGYRYAHYYDHYGVHWYGFYHGPRFYWTRYWSGYWWWWDVGFARWVYWYNGYWWWPGPAGVAYVYVDNSYYPYDDGAVVVKEPVVQSPPATVPDAQAGNEFKSPDGRRSVQLVDTRGDAFLYDQTSGNPVFMKYLGTGVEAVKYSGKAEQILLEFKDGSFALFDADGDPMDAPASPAALSHPAKPLPPTPPAQPDSVPPPPDAAPGQTGLPGQSPATSTP